MFFQAFGPGPGSPKLIGPVGGDFGGFPNPPPDPSMQLRIDMRGTPRKMDLNRQIATSKVLSKTMMRQKPKFARPLPRHQDMTTIESLKVGDEHGKPASPRDLEHSNAFNALEYSSPRYLVEEGSQSPRKLPGHHTRGEPFKGANEALEVLEDTFMVSLELTSAK